jgi:hypothetical protein
MRRNRFLTVTAVVETGAGVALLTLPSAVVELLCGMTTTSPETLTLGRILGAALVAVGIACWVGRNDPGYAVKVGLMAAALLYNVAVALLLSYGGVTLNLTGVLLWPAVAVHTALAVWCLACLWQNAP